MFKLLNTNFKAYLFITIAAILLFIPFIGNMPLFDWDEINFAECAREMLISNNYSNVQLYFQPFWEKPPLFIWLQAMSMNVFGMNEFSARFPNALCGIITLLVLYRTGKSLNDHRFGLVWAFVYAASLLPHLFFKSGIIDPWFNLFIYISVFYLIKHSNNPVGKSGYQTSTLAGFFLGLALLTKGPAALILVGLTVTVFFVLGRFKKITETKFLIAFFAAFLITGLSWFTIEALKGNTHIIKEFIDYQIRLFKTEDSGHGGPFIYHFIILLIGCFPSSLFLILAHSRSLSDTPFQKHSKRWMMILFWVVLLLFSIVKTKIVHYSSLCYFPLTYLATYSIIKLLNDQYSWKRWLNWGFIIISGLLGILFITIGCLPFFKNYLLSGTVIDDLFAKENLKAQVNWLGIEWLIGVVFLAISFWSIYRINKASKNYIYLIFCASLFSTYSLIMIIAPKIEQYSQHAAIEFYQACSKHQIEVETIGFKSYASLFYGKLEPNMVHNATIDQYVAQKSISLEKQGINAATSFSLIRTHYLIEGEIKKPVCFVAKINDEDVIKRDCPKLKELYRKNGFIFYVRNPDTK